MKDRKPRWPRSHSSSVRSAGRRPQVSSDTPDYRNTDKEDVAPNRPGSPSGVRNERRRCRVMSSNRTTRCGESPGSWRFHGASRNRATRTTRRPGKPSRTRFQNGQVSIVRDPESCDRPGINQGTYQRSCFGEEFVRNESSLIQSPFVSRNCARASGDSGKSSWKPNASF